jgi:uncharacterized protein (TIGR02271 family)
MIKDEPIDRARTDGARDSEVATIPLVEERLQVGKREVESGRLRIRVDVSEREERVIQDLERDEVTIERVPRNERLTEIPHVRLEGSVTVIPVVEEVVVVEKALMLVEEIRIHRASATERADIPVTVRSEEAFVEREDVSLSSTSERGERP